MQDEIRGPIKPAEPTIRPMPKTSHTVQENIVRFYHIKSEHEQLHEVLHIAKHQQARQIQERATQPKAPLLGAPAQTPLAAEQAGTTLHATVQPYIQIEIQLMIGLASMVGAGDIAGKLKTLLAKFPNLSPEEVSSLNSLLDQIRQRTLGMPKEKQEAYYKAEMEMYKRLMQVNAGQIKQYQADISKLQQQIDALNWYFDDMQQLKDLLSAFQSGSGKLTWAQYQKLIDLMESLKKRYSSLPADEKAAVDKVFQTIGSLKNQQGVSLREILSEYYLEQLVGQFLLDPDRPQSEKTSEALKQWLLQLKIPKFDSGGVPFFGQIAADMERAVNAPGFPFGKGYSGETFVTRDGNYITCDVEKFDNDLAANTQITSVSIEVALIAYQQAYTVMDQKREDLQNDINSLNLVINSLNDLDDSFGRAAAADAAMLSIIPGSLPDDFRHAILDIYMPQQEAFLRSMAEILYFNNMGASIGNALLKEIIGFDTAGSKFDFGHNLVNDGKGFTGDWQQAKNRLQEEIDEANADLSKCRNALDVIQQKIDAINKDTQLTGTQKSTLIKNLEQYKGDLKADEMQLTKVHDILSTLKVSQIPGDPQHFNITADPPSTTWEADLSKAEHDVINGYTDPKDIAAAGGFKGGLVPTSSEITGDQQGFADQSQQQQTKLQMTMTEIQQEWSIVSTAMQLLNQMYMAPAQAIYK